MNRGYWSRYYCFNTFIERFIENEENDLQIISIGCGLDTAPFNMLDKYNKKNFKYFECDLDCVVSQKIKFIKKNKDFLNFLDKFSSKPLVDYNKPELISEKYVLFPCDLNKTEQIIESFTHYGIDSK